MTQEVLLEMIQYFGNDVKRINHAMKVFSFAFSICHSEKINNDKKLIIELSSILHDIGIHRAKEKYNSTAGNYQQIEGPPIARKILEEKNIPEAIIKRVCHCIENHHNYTKIDDIDLQILIEADFIVNIFEDNMKEKSIEGIKIKFFKTKTGIEILNTMYLKK